MTSRLEELPIVAQRLGLSWHATYSKVLRGELPATKRGARWMVDATAVDRLLATRAEQD